jgi:polysaccharide pyruvyl transferase WcaK-like protein
MILLHGYYGERNAGDDAFATVCAERLSVSSGAVWIMAAELPEAASAHASPLLLRRRWKGLAERVERRRISSVMAKGARLILGGGSLLRSTAGIAEVSALLDMSPGGGHAALGVSIGPWRDPAAEAACARLLNRFDFVGVRDDISLARARDLAIATTVELTFDLAPLLMVEEPGRVRSSGALGVALCGPAVTPQEFEHLAEILSQWLQSTPGREVVLLPFNVHPRKGDIALHTALAGRLQGCGKVSLEPYQGDPRATWRRVAELEALVAMRLHAGIFGYCTRTPTLLLPYEEKCQAWAAISQHPADFVRPVTATTLDDLERLVVEAPLAALPLAAAYAAALRNFEAIAA